MTKLSKAQAEKLAEIVTATLGPKGMLFMTPKSAKVLEDAGLVECNAGVPDPEDSKRIAVRATPTGLTYAENATAPATEEEAIPMDANTAPTETVASFSIENDVEMPKVKRTSRKASPYPFDDLEIGQSFFVPNTEARPNQAKSLASTVSSASLRYAVEDGTKDKRRKNDAGEYEIVQVTKHLYRRMFRVRPVDENGMSGARVWRVEVPADMAVVAE